MSKLAVLFPGIGYHCDKPLLYYGKKMATLAGYDQCISLSYSFQGSDIKGNRAKMEEAFYALFQQTKQALQDVDFSAYEEIVFISKSIGTIIAAVYAQEKQITCKNVYFTPLEDTFRFAPQNGLIFTGSADNWVNPEKLQGLISESGMPYRITKDANHSLETGDPIADLEELQEIMKMVKAFI